MNFKGQSAIEFVIIIMVVLFLFVGLLYFIQGKIADSQNQAVSVAVNEIALTVQDEVNLAHNSANGYSRSFFLPLNLNGLDYTVQILEDSVYVSTQDGKHAVALPISEVTGNIFLGNNLIYRINNTIFLN
ncbi:MAG: hypothetical protein ACP5N7_04430 [Candidatus Pacearchaeota archaeon]